MNGTVTSALLGQRGRTQTKESYVLLAAHQYRYIVILLQHQHPLYLGSVCSLPRLSQNMYPRCCVLSNRLTASSSFNNIMMLPLRNQKEIHVHE